MQNLDNKDAMLAQYSGNEPNCHHRNKFCKIQNVPDPAWPDVTETSSCPPFNRDTQIGGEVPTCTLIMALLWQEKCELVDARLELDLGSITTMESFARWQKRK